MSLTTLLQGVNPFLPEETLSSPVSVESSNIKSVGYDPKKALLRVAFRSGGLYDYTDVPYSRYKRMLRSKSKGKYFHSQLRGKYEVEKLASKLSRIKPLNISSLSAKQVDALFSEAIKSGQDVYKVAKPEYDKRKDPTKRLIKKMIRNKANASIDLRKKQSPLPELREIFYQ